MTKLFIIVRRDLDPGLLVAQACHAVSAFACEHPRVHADWHLGGKNIVILEAPGAIELDALLTKSKARGIAGAAFHETDLAGELTAIALTDEARKLVSSLPLALRPAKAA